MPEENSIDNTNTNDNVTGTSDIVAEVAEKIRAASNVLIALSNDPSVDEMASAIGLSLFLGKLGKHAIAIYSGSTPNALEFLKPEDTFESSTDTLQDFVIALNKDKADHLRYKLDGDFVKIYITPYRSRVSESDLEFSYGDYNVDLVISLDVANGADLDSALREHGRIMHDASIVNITTGNPGRLGEIEWSDKSASSVAEMITKLLYRLEDKSALGKDEATALLTGIVAATDRFSNAKTTPETMQIASRLMKSGANQQLISKNITPEIENELIGASEGENKSVEDTTKLNIEHQEGVEEAKPEETKPEKIKPEEAVSIKGGAEASAEGKPEEKISAVEDQPEESASQSENVTEKEPETDSVQSDSVQGGTIVNDTPGPSIEIKKEPMIGEREPMLEGASVPDNSGESSGDALMDDLKTAEANLSQAGAETTPIMEREPLKIESDKNSSPDVLPPVDIASLEQAAKEEAMSNGQNPAMANTPSAPTTPEVNGVPEINYMPLPGDEVLPPPPTPPIDVNNPAIPESPSPSPSPIEPAGPQVSPTNDSFNIQSVPPDQIYTPQASAPEAFKIPDGFGM